MSEAIKEFVSSGALAANNGSNDVTPLTFAGGVWTAGSNVAVGTNPYGVAISPDGLRALAANAGSSNVTPLTFASGVWTAGSNVAVGSNPHIGIVIYSQ